MLSRKIKILENNFLIDRDRKNLNITSSGTSPAEIVKILKMTLTPPCDHTELVKVRYLVK